MHSSLGEETYKCHRQFSPNEIGPPNSVDGLKVNLQMWTAPAVIPLMSRNKLLLVAMLCFLRYDNQPVYISICHFHVHIISALKIFGGPIFAVKTFQPDK